MMQLCFLYVSVQFPLPGFSLGDLFQYLKRQILDDKETLIYKETKNYCVFRVNNDDEEARCFIIPRDSPVFCRGAGNADMENVRQFRSISPMHDTGRIEEITPTLSNKRNSSTEE